MKTHLLEKLHPNLTAGTPLNIFKILKNLTEKVTGLLRSRVEKIEKISNLVVAHHLLGAALVIEKKYSLKFYFEKNVVKSGQTVVKQWSN